MQRVRGGERVVHRVPVAEVVLHVEAGDAQRRRVRERAAELRRGRHRSRSRRGARRRRARDLGEELPRELGDVGEAAVAGGARRQMAASSRGCVWAISTGRSCGWRHVPLCSDQVADGGTAHQRGEHVGCGRLAQVLERLERLVGEVDGVTAVDEDVVGDGGEHHALRRRRARPVPPARSRARARPRRPSGSRRTGGTTRRAGPVRISSAVSNGAQREAGRVVARVAGDEREPVHQRERAVGSSSVGSTFAIAMSTVSPAPQPAVAVARAEGDAARTISSGGDPGVEQPEHRLRDHEREPRLEPVVEPLDAGGRSDRRRGARRRARRCRRR